MWPPLQSSDGPVVAVPDGEHPQPPGSRATALKLPRSSRRPRPCAYARDRSVPGLVRDIVTRRLRLSPGLGRAKTTRREEAHAYPRWPDLLAVPKKVSGDGCGAAIGDVC